MKRLAGALLVVLALSLLAPSMLAQEERGEFGVFADYTRFHNLNNQNFWGLGGQLGINLNNYVQLEGRMAYDFERNFSTGPAGTVGGVVGGNNFTNTRFRILDGLFGPKFQTGAGPVRLFGTVKGGFVNFMVNNEGVPSSFATQVGNVPSGNTHGAVYPGGGVEFFLGHTFGIRAEVGDEIYFENGAHSNLKVMAGPTFRW
ncbi:MAG: outer membrane beta-barrel protein [Terriglobales bacterium]